MKNKFLIKNQLILIIGFYIILCGGSGFMYRHVFILGLVLAFVCSMDAMAWPTTPATGIWTDYNHTALADMRCGDCCKSDCWLPDGTFYDSEGTFVNNCTSEPSEPICRANETYSVVDGACTFEWKCPLHQYCPHGQYNIGFSSCFDLDTEAIGYGSWEFNGTKRSATTYGVAEPGHWAVKFNDGTIKGIASCNSTDGMFGVPVIRNFSNTSNGYHCWCQITSPSVSRWVYTTPSDYDANHCAASCADRCAALFSDDSYFRMGMLGMVDCGGNTIADLNALNVYLDDSYAYPDYFWAGHGAAVSQERVDERGYEYSCDGSDGFDPDSEEEDWLEPNCNDSEFSDMSPGYWRVGVRSPMNTQIEGRARCISFSGTTGQPDEATDSLDNLSPGRYCWCKIVKSAVSPWIFLDDLYNTDDCADECAVRCALYIKTDSDFRSNMFGI